MDRNKVRAYRAKENMIKDTHDEEALKRFYEEYGDVPQWREYKPGKNQLVCLISDLKTAIPTSVMFSVPNIDQFSSRYGLCQKQIEAEKLKIPGSIMRLDSVEFEFIQRHNMNTEYRQKLVVFLDPNSVAIANDLQELLQIQDQFKQLMVVICLKGMTELKRSDYTISFALPFMNVIADRQGYEFETSHRYFYLVNENGEIITQGTALDKIPMLSQFKY